MQLRLFSFSRGAVSPCPDPWTIRVRVATGNLLFIASLPSRKVFVGGWLACRLARRLVFMNFIKIRDKTACVCIIRGYVGRLRADAYPPPRLLTQFADADDFSPFPCFSPRLLFRSSLESDPFLFLHRRIKSNKFLTLVRIAAGAALLRDPAEYIAADKVAGLFFAWKISRTRFCVPQLRDFNRLRGLTRRACSLIFRWFVCSFGIVSGGIRWWDILEFTRRVSCVW